MPRDCGGNYARRLSVEAMPYPGELVRECPSRVKLRSPGAQLGSPLYPQEQTSPAGPVRSEKCHQGKSTARLHASGLLMFVLSKPATIYRARYRVMTAPKAPNSANTASGAAPCAASASESCCTSRSSANTTMLRDAQKIAA